MLQQRPQFILWCQQQLRALRLLPVVLQTAVVPSTRIKPIRHTREIQQRLWQNFDSRKFLQEAWIESICGQNWFQKCEHRKFGLSLHGIDHQQKSHLDRRSLCFGQSRLSSTVIGLYHHDIALLILRTPINYTVAAQPVCLQRDRSNLVVGKRAVIAGWGKVSLSNIRSLDMQFMDVPLASWDACLRVYASSGALDSQKSIEGQWMCAGGEGRDVCQGFGGAPLLITETSVGVSQTSQIGIMSFGSENCGGIRIPSVYTSIAHFYNWIQENLPAE